MITDSGTHGIPDALTFSSPLLPTSDETKYLLDNLRANCWPRETTRLRAIVASSPADIALYKNHLLKLGVAQAAHLPNAPLSSTEATSFPSMELVAIDAALERMQKEYDVLLKYSSLCSSALSPIRRLPPEILIQVFLLCAPVPTNQWELNSKDYTAELHRLIRHDLLQLAQVCAHWRAQALGTPAFWRVIDLDMMFWSSKMLPLVRTALNRSARSPLQVRIGAPEDVVMDRHLLELVVQHCSRWQTALFCMEFSFFASLSAVKGNLPLLETVYISGPTNETDPEAPLASAAMELFSVAPRLIEIAFSGPAKALRHVPWSQLRRFEYVDVRGSELSTALSILRYFPPGMQFELRRLMSCPVHRSVEFTLTPFASDLISLVVEFGSHSSSALADVLDRLTLPSLVSLEVLSLHYPVSPIIWDQSAFQRFCARSKCGASLTTLYLLHVALPPADLLASLASLPALTALVIADHWVDSGAIQEHVLLTDEVFRRLVWTDALHQLLPKLRLFGCLTLLRFDEAVYLDFARSRAVQRRSCGEGFESYVRWLPGAARTLRSEVLDGLQRLQADEGLVGSIEAATEVEMQTFFY
ncbi:hypothetical protein DFH09DRAFT_1201273 [Mycena vulgaris]|nr:hypothetical protein DFH09DRAFT_1201273 [Mycena vulgaris]